MAAEMPKLAVGARRDGMPAPSARSVAEQRCRKTRESRCGGFTGTIGTGPMAKTVHVFPSGEGWAVKRQGSGDTGAFFPTQKDAVASARFIVKKSASGQRSEEHTSELQ